MDFEFNYWESPDGSKKRVYINGEFISGLKVYFMGDALNNAPRVFGDGDNRAYPEPYASELIPAQAVAEDALMQAGIDPDDLTWDDLLVAAGE